MTRRATKAAAAAPTATPAQPATAAHPSAACVSGQATSSGEVTRSERGEGWELRRADCLVGMAEMADDSVDVVITDPPYSQHTHDKQWVGAALTEQGARRVKTSHTGLTFAHVTDEQATECARQWARLARRWTLVFTDLEGIALWRGAVACAGLDYVRTCIWDKVDGAPQFTGDRPAAGAEAIVVAHRPGKKFWNGGGRRNVFHHAVNGQRGDKPHPTTKPLPLMRELVQLFSLPGELVLDSFSGSGSTGVACGLESRRFLGFELSQDYFDIACRRMRGDEAKPRPEQPGLFDLLAGVE